MYFSMGRFRDWRGNVSKVSAPVLVLYGGRDLWVESTSRAFAAAGGKFLGGS